MNRRQQKFWGLDHIKTPSSETTRSRTPNPISKKYKRPMTEREKLKSARSKLSRSATHFVRIIQLIFWR